MSASLPSRLRLPQGRRCAFAWGTCHARQLLCIRGVAGACSYDRFPAFEGRVFEEGYLTRLGGTGVGCKTWWIGSSLRCGSELCNLAWKLFAHKTNLCGLWCCPQAAELLAVVLALSVLSNVMVASAEGSGAADVLLHITKVRAVLQYTI